MTGYGFVNKYDHMTIAFSECNSTQSWPHTQAAGPRTRASWKSPRYPDIFRVIAINTPSIKIFFASKDGPDCCGGRGWTKMSAQKVESNHCASQRLQVWSLQPGPPNVIWTLDLGSSPILNYNDIVLVIIGTALSSLDVSRYRIYNFFSH